MTTPAITDYAGLLNHAKEVIGGRPVRAALAVPSAQGWCIAFDRAIREGLIDPTVVGDEALLNQKCREYGLSMEGVKVIDINQPDMAFMTSAQMAARGEIELIVKGRGSTVEFLKHLLNKDAQFVPKGATLSHIGVIKPDRYDRLLFLTDAGVVPRPDLKTKLALIGNLSRFTAACGVPEPRIAVLAAVEAIYPQMPVTTEAAVLAKMSERGQIKGCFVDGPLSFDVAIDHGAAEAKGIVNSEVAGQADAMLAPDIETANGVFKAMALYGQAQVGGQLFGGRVPVALGNRWDTPVTRFNAIILGVLAAVAAR